MADLEESNFVMTEGEPFREPFRLRDVDADGVETITVLTANDTVTGEIRETRDSVAPATLIATLLGVVTLVSDAAGEVGLAQATVESIKPVFPNVTDPEILLGYLKATINRITNVVNVAALDQTAKSFTFNGADFTEQAKMGSILTIANSTGNDGPYVVLFSTISGGNTTVFVNEAITDATVDGDGTVTKVEILMEGEINYRRVPDAA